MPRWGGEEQWPAPDDILAFPRPDAPFIATADCLETQLKGVASAVSSDHGRSPLFRPTALSGLRETRYCGTSYTHPSADRLDLALKYSRRRDSIRAAALLRSAGRGGFGDPKVTVIF